MSAHRDLFSGSLVTPNCIGECLRFGDRVGVFGIRPFLFYETLIGSCVFVFVLSAHFVMCGEGGGPVTCSNVRARRKNASDTWLVACARVSCGQGMSAADRFLARASSVSFGVAVGIATQAQ